MRVFVTGATGFIGSAVVRELLGAGHQVTGLARSDGRRAVAAAGAAVFRGSLEDTGGLREAAANADGVIHTGYIHDFSPTANPAAAAAVDGRRSPPSARHSKDRASRLWSPPGCRCPRPGRSAPRTCGRRRTRTTRASRSGPPSRSPAAGVRASVVRLPPSVHGEGDYAFVPALIGIARATGMSAYIGDGANVWPAVHRLDAARLFRLALEAGSRRDAAQRGR